MIVTSDRVEWITVAEAAEGLGVSVKTVYAWITRLEKVRVDGLLHVRRLDVARVEKSRRDTPQSHRNPRR